MDYYNDFDEGAAAWLREPAFRWLDRPTADPRQEALL